MRGIFPGCDNAHRSRTAPSPDSVHRSFGKASLAVRWHCPIDFPQHSFRLRPIRGIPAPMSEENISVSINKKIAAPLKNIIATVGRLLHAVTQQLKVAQQRCRRKNLKSRKTLQRKCTISLALRIGENREGPVPLFLIGGESARLGERNHEHRDAALVEFGFSFGHLTEVRLARQSGEVTEKDQQRAIGDSIAEFHRLAA